MRIKPLLALACLACASLAARADWRPAAVFVEGSVAEAGAYSLAAGVVWPWDWRRQTSGGAVTVQTEAFFSHWSGKTATDRVSFSQVGLQPLVRYHFGQPGNAWFVEGGIGLSYTDRVYVTANKTFSTRFNFKDTIGVGRGFGANGAHEVGLRITHFSNAGIKHPNPGENFLQLRYATKF